MHTAARNFVVRSLREFPEPKSVIEIGSRDVNGSIRTLFPRARYTGIDLRDGPGVDWVGDALDFEPDDKVDCVVICEVLEHAPEWAKLVLVSASWLAPGGHLIITCAGPGRHPHSGVDGAELRAGEYYRNLAVAELCDALMDAGLEIHTCHRHERDLQALAQDRREPV